MYRLPFLLLFLVPLGASAQVFTQSDVFKDTLRTDTLIVQEMSAYDGGTYTVRSRAYLVHSDTVEGMAVLLDTFTTQEPVGDLFATKVHYCLRAIPGFAVRRSLFTEYYTATGDRIKPQDLYMFKPHE